MRRDRVKKYNFCQIGDRLSRVFGWLHGGVLDLLYPKFCLICGKYGQHVCFGCYNQIELTRTDTCFVCGRISKNAKLCPGCKTKSKLNVVSVYWAGNYHDPILKQLIHEYKYSGVVDLSDLLAEMLCQRLLKFVNTHQDLVVVPVPLHHKKQTKRGYNQSEMIARYISGKFLLPGGLALRRIKKTSSQVGLSKRERVSNITGAFICCDNDLVRGKNILLIDDVATTGATVGECSRVLREAGAKRIFVATVARD